MPDLNFDSQNALYATRGPHSEVGMLTPISPGAISL